MTLVWHPASDLLSLNIPEKCDPCKAPGQWFIVFKHPREMWLLYGTQRAMCYLWTPPRDVTLVWRPVIPSHMYEIFTCYIGCRFTAWGEELNISLHLPVISSVSVSVHGSALSRGCSNIILFILGHVCPSKPFLDAELEFKKGHSFGLIICHFSKAPPIIVLKVCFWRSPPSMFFERQQHFCYISESFL